MHMRIVALFLIFTLVFGQKLATFTQILDHFDRSNTATFDQRYYYEDFTTDVHTPCLNVLFVNGEGPMNSMSPAPEHPLYKLVEANKGRIFTLEHRFYGQSVPTADLSAENLRFLTTHQAIHDVAWFISSTDVTLHGGETHPGTTFDRWLVVGGSYSGGLVSWIRNKFPHLVHGAWASSAVINPILDYPTFDTHTQEYIKAWSQDCFDAAQFMNQRVAALIQGGRYRQFIIDEMLLGQPVGAPSPLDGDLLYAIADITAQAVQYGHTGLFCDNVTAHWRKSGINTEFTTVARDFAAYIRALNVLHGADPNEYVLPGYSSTSMFEDRKITNSAARCWWWQTCTDLSWWQRAPSNTYAETLRHPLVDFDYHRDVCATVFADAPNGFLARSANHTPPVQWAATYLGGLAELTTGAQAPLLSSATNIFFWNAAQDPWSEVSAGSVFDLNERGIQSVSAFDKSGTVGHCDDLHKPKATDTQALVNSRLAAVKWVQTVFAEVVPEPIF